MYVIIFVHTRSTGKRMCSNESLHHEYNTWLAYVVVGKHNFVCPYNHDHESITDVSFPGRHVDNDW